MHTQITDENERVAIYYCFKMNLILINRLINLKIKKRIPDNNTNIGHRSI